MLLLFPAALFVVLILFSMPIVFALGVAGVAGLFVGGYDLQVLSSSMVSGSQSWVLLAIPAFVFAGGLMEKCGMSHALVEFARALVGWVKGGLGMSVIVVAYFFSDMCGSKMAEVSALGATLMPPLRRVHGPPGGGWLPLAARPASGAPGGCLLLDRRLLWMGDAGAAGDFHDRRRRSDQHLGGRCDFRWFCGCPGN